MPSRCGICTAWSNKKKNSKKFHRLSDSEYATALRIFVRLPRPAHICPACYERIRVAAINQDMVVKLPSAMGRDAGSGVFVRVDVKPGEVVTTYDGLTLLKEDASLMPTTSHMRKKNAHHSIDARGGHRKYGGGIGGFINRVEQGKRPNVRILSSTDRKTKIDRVVIRVPVKSKGGRVIHAGTELKTVYCNHHHIPPPDPTKSWAGRRKKPMTPAQLAYGYKLLAMKADTKQRR